MATIAYTASVDARQLNLWIESVALGWVFVLAAAAFLVLYFGFAFGSLVLRGKILPALRVGAVVDDRPVPDGQVRREIQFSLVSILIFALYGVLTIVALRSGVVKLNTELRASALVLDLALVFLWNELHFYFSHRLLHQRWLMKRVHVAHHRSRVPTPFSSYAFHWFEAVVLGGVMLTAMLLHNFHVLVLLFLPLLSIIGNAAGHLNYELFPGRSSRKFFSMTRRHGAHHALCTKNYAFLLSWPDRIFGTEILPEGEAERLRIFPRVLGPRSRYLVGVLVLVLVSASYRATNQHSLYDPVLLTPSWVDRLIPLMPWTGWIYVTFPVICIVVFLQEKNVEQLNHFIWAALAMNLLTQVVFLLLPTTLDRSAALMTPIAEGGSSILAHIQAADTPANCLPSLHVSGTVLPALFAWKRQHTGHKWLAAWAFLVCLSTLTTKQHLVADVLSGALLAAFMYWYFFYRITFRAEPSGTIAL